MDFRVALLTRLEYLRIVPSSQAMSKCLCLHVFIHSFIADIYVAPLQVGLLRRLLCLHMSCVCIWCASAYYTCLHMSLCVSTCRVSIYRAYIPYAFADVIYSIIFICVFPYVLCLHTSNNCLWHVFAYVVSELVLVSAH